MTNNNIEVRVGQLIIGGNQPIVIQSMINADTMNTSDSVKQILALQNKGCQLVRLTASDESSARNLYNIKNELIKLGSSIALVADIHFQPKAAMIAAQTVEKIRINPGNYVDRGYKAEYTEQEYRDILKRAADNLLPLVETCKQHSTAIRIGVNHGSLSQRILFRYGNTPRAMAESAMEYLRIFQSLSFNQIVISLKASQVPTMYQANKILFKMMQEENLLYPLHLGVTEAGNEFQGRMKSLCGIGSLLKQGIGDTIRVSLTEDPVKEIPVAYTIANLCSQRKTIHPDYKDTDEHTFSKDDIEYITNQSICLLEKEKTTLKKQNHLDKDILQSLDIERYEAEFIACPSCGRTKYNIQKALSEVKHACSKLKNLKIAVMGCIVNGPGEMADADYGYIGCGNGKVNLYRAKTLVYNNVDEHQAIDKLIELIKKDGKWNEK